MRRQHVGREHVGVSSNGYSFSLSAWATRPVRRARRPATSNLTSYAFGKNAEELQAHIAQYPIIGRSQPFNPDVGDPFGIELARLLANFSASVKLLISAQRAILRDIWPSVGKQLSEFEQAEYTAKRLAVFEADE
ncbi:MAG: hypothetical protein QOJ37_1101, partial [Pseudonocardiales bacterium]|nr:hypothetical protein [Pseudonocardiales bacterium]